MAGESSIKDALALTGLILVLSVIGSMFAPAFESLGSPLVWLLFYQLVIVGAPLAAFLYQRRGEVSAGATVPTVFESALAIAAGAGVALANVGIVIPLSPLTDGGGGATTLAVTGAALPIALLAFAIVPAIIEELLFRGVLLRAFESRGRVLALVVSSLLFAGFHFSAAQLIPLFMVGLVTGIATLRTGNVTVAILVHAANNAVIVFLIAGAADLSEAIGVGALGGTAAVASLVALRPTKARLR